MKKPKPPLGFIPVDSEEAKGIGDDVLVNYACFDGGVWVYYHDIMYTVRCESIPENHYHVQLPPAVEWEEVWGWEVEEEQGRIITKHGKHFETIGNVRWKNEHLDAIVAALNEMEESNG